VDWWVCRSAWMQMLTGIVLDQTVGAGARARGGANAYVWMPLFMLAARCMGLLHGLESCKRYSPVRGRHATT